MIDASVTLGEMRVLRDILQIVGDGRFKFPELESKLSTEVGHKLKGGSLSKWISRIELAIGGTEAVKKLLVDRNNTGSSLTPEGKVICAAFRKSLVDLDEQIAPLCKNVRQRIRIGLTNSLTSNLLPRVLTEDQEFREFLSEHAQIDIKVVEGEPDELERHVETGWVDFAIAPKAPGDAQRIPFHELKRVLIFNPLGPGMGKLVRFVTSNKLGDEEIRQLKKCLAEVTVLIPPRRVMPKLQLKFLPRPTDGRQIKLPQASLRRAWAKLGLGAAITHEELFLQEPTGENGKLLSIDLSDQIDTTKLWFYFKDDIQSLCKPTRMLVEAIQRVFPKPSPMTDADRASLPPH